MSYMTLGYLTLDAPPADTVTAAAEAGFKSVGIRITGRRVSDPYTQVLDNPAMVREIKKRVDGSGIHLSNISAYHFYPDVQFSSLQKILDITAELGVKIVVANNYMQEAQFLEIFPRYAEAANKYGIRLAIEFMKYSEAKSIEHAMRLVDKSGAPNAGFLIDPLHLDRSGGTAAAIKAVDPKRIIFVQLCDAMRRPGDVPLPELMKEARTARLPAGKGNLPLYDFLDALPANTEIEYEVPMPEHAGKPLAERAKIALNDFRNYMQEYEKKRGKKFASF